MSKFALQKKLGSNITGFRFYSPSNMDHWPGYEMSPKFVTKSSKIMKNTPFLKIKIILVTVIPRVLLLVHFKAFWLIEFNGKKDNL